MSETPSAPDGDTMRVGLVGSCVWPVPGGMEVYLRDLSRALVADGHDVRVVTRFGRARPEDMAGLHSGAEDPRQYSDGGVQVSVVRPARGRATLLRPVHRMHFHAPGLARALFRGALGAPVRDALHGVEVVHYSGTGRELLGFVAQRSAAALGVPFIVTPHTHEGIWGDSPLDADLYRRADRVIAVTHDEAQRLGRMGVDAGRIGVVGHGVSVGGGGDADRFRARHGLGGPVVLFLGRKTPDKGYDLLLEAAPAIWARQPGAHLVLAGTPGKPREIADVLTDPRVHDLGPLDDQEREDAYAACDVFVLPSEAEAFGLVVLEAWAYAKPVVVADIPTLRERVVAAGGGLLAPRDSDAIADAVCTLLGDGDLRARMGAAGAAVAAASSWSDAARHTAQIYAQAAADYAERPHRDD